MQNIFKVVTLKHVLVNKSGHDTVLLFCTPPFLYKFRFFGQNTFRKGVLLLKLTPIETLTLVIWDIITNGKTRSLLVIKVDIATPCGLYIIPCTALIKLEVDVQFFLDPTI